MRKTDYVSMDNAIMLEHFGYKPEKGEINNLMVYRYETVINPEILEKSVEMVYLPGGEGCLSVDREVSGLIHRPYKIRVQGYVYDFDKTIYDGDSTTDFILKDEWKQQ